MLQRGKVVVEEYKPVDVADEVKQEIEEETKPKSEIRAYKFHIYKDGRFRRRQSLTGSTSSMMRTVSNKSQTFSKSYKRSPGSRAASRFMDPSPPKRGNKTTAATSILAKSQQETLVPLKQTRTFAPVSRNRSDRLAPVSDPYQSL